MRNSFAKKFTELAKNNHDLVLLSGDIGNRLFDELRTTRPNQFINCGIAEASMMGIAAGLAQSGLQPVVYTIAPFTTTRCLEQIKIDVCYQNVPVIIIGTGSGLSYASLGPTHHSLEDFAILKSFPEIKILAPWDPFSLENLLKFTICEKKPTYIRIGKKGEQNLTLLPTPSIGKNLTLFQGKGVCLMATGTICREVLIAKEKLNSEGIFPEIVFAHSVKPLDMEHLNYLVKKFKTIITIEEHFVSGGFGESILSNINLISNNTKVLNIGAQSEFMHTIGSYEYAKKYYGIDSESILNAVKQFLSH